MRKTKVIEEPQIERKRILHWKCPTCRTWVKEEMSNRCVACKQGTTTTRTETPSDKKPTAKKSTTKKPAPKMFSDLTDMFGH